MALRTAANPVAETIPAFESQEEEFEQAAAPQPQQVVQESKPEPVSTTALAKPAARSVAAPQPNRKVVPAFTELQNVIPVEDVAAMGVGAFPRITVDTGSFSLDKEDIGKEFKIELISWNLRYMAVTGSQDEEGKGKTRVSFDGETIEGTNESIHGYVQSLLAQGYKNAQLKTYMDIWGSLVEKNGKIIENPLDRPMVQLQLSPQSVAAWKAFQGQVGFFQTKGLVKEEDLGIVTVRAEKHEYNGNRYGVMRFALK